MARLLQADASILTVEDDGRTPIDKARRGNHTAIATAMELWVAGSHDEAVADLNRLGTVCSDLFEAALIGTQAEVDRLAPIAASLGVISKVGKLVSVCPQRRTRAQRHTSPRLIVCVCVCECALPGA